MTQSRKLKKTIRARARKTGESYTAARRMVLQHKTRARIASRADKAAPVTASVAGLPAMLRKGEPRLVARTGHGWEHWFLVLDRFGSAHKGHTASARYLAEDHGVDGWYAQQITVAYERARGLRAENQRMSGSYEVSVSKVLHAPVSAVVRALRDPRARARWTATLDPELRGAYEAALAGPRGLRERQQGGARMRLKAAGGVTVALYLDPKSNGKSSLVAQNMNLKAAADVVRYRATWKEALAALGRQLDG